MKIKKFHGKSFKEVLETVKREMGQDAVILSSSTKKDQLSGSSYIEVTVALDEKDDEVIFKNSEEKNIVDDGLIKEIERIKQEVFLLRESINTLLPSLQDNSKKGLYSLLIKNGVDAHLALLLLEKANDINDLRSILDGELKFTQKSFLDERGFVFYGLPGVGKTTTIFKIGKLLRAKKEKVLILSLDQRISSVAYIKEMALKLKCEAKVIKDSRELYKIINRESDRVRILIDTPGDTNISYVSELKDLLKDSPLKKCLLLDASMAMQSSFKAFKTVESSALDCIGFSKLDIAYPYGSVYNLSVLSGKPVSFLTQGSWGEEKSAVYPPDVMPNLILGGFCEN